MSISVCANMVQAHDPDRFLSVMAAPPALRERLLVLYAFNLEIARAPWASSEEMIAEMRLQWWADAMSDLYNGTLHAHAVLSPLAQIIKAHDLPQPLFMAMIAARRFDIYSDGHADLGAFEGYINDTTGGLIQLAAMTLGAGSAAKPVIANFAYGIGVANLFRALPTLYARGRHPIPVDCALDRNAVAKGQVPDNLARALRDIAQDALGKMHHARQNRDKVARAALPALLSGWQAGGVLKIVANRPENTLQQPLETSEFYKKLSLMGRNFTKKW